MASILTNVSAMAALATLRTIGSEMETTQSRISSGQKVANASDNAAYWSIATTMRSDASSLSTVSDAMGLGAAKVDTAYAGMNAAIDVVKTIKDKLVAAQETSADKTKIQKEITQLQAQLKSISSSASFSGENWLQADLTKAGGTIGKTVVASFTRDASGNVKVNQVGYNLTKDNVLFDTGAVAGKSTGLLDSNIKIQGKQALVNITTAVPDTITGDALVTGKATYTAGSATAVDKYVTAGGDTYIRYGVKGVQQRDADGKDLWVKAIATGTAPTAGSANSVNATLIDGTGATNATDGTNPYYIQTKSVVTQVSVAASTELALTSPQNPVATHAMGDGTGTYTAGTGAFTITSSTSTTPPTGADLDANNAAIAQVLDKNFFRAEKTGNVMTVYSNYSLTTVGTGQYTAGTTQTWVKLGNDDTWVKSTSVAAGVATEYNKGVQGTKIGSVYYDIDQTNSKAYGTTETDFKVSVTNLDISKLADTAKAAGMTETQALDTMISAVDKQLSSMTSAAADLGSITQRIDLQKSFLGKLSDSLTSGIGRLVDADMNQESTRLKALQTQQQLAVQSLSIANNDAQQILSLFR